jgi:hypothetical protein
MYSTHTISELVHRGIIIYNKEGLTELLMRFINYVSKRIPICRFINSIILNSLFNRITREDLLLKHETYNLSNGSTVEINSPDYHFGSVPERLDRRSKIYDFDFTFVSVINGVDIIGSVGAPIVSRHSVVLEDFSARKHKLEEYVYNTASLRELLLYRLSGKPCPDDRIKEACSFLNIQSAGYSDWVQSGMSRFQGLERYAEETGRRPTVILRSDPPE